MFRTLAKSASVPLHGVCGVEMSVEQVDGLQTLPLHTVSVRGRVQLLFGSQDRYPQLKFILAGKKDASSAHTHVGQGQRSPIMLQVVECGHDGESVWCRSS